MQALLENEIVSLYRQEKSLSEFDKLIFQIETADAVVKSNIENKIVAQGEKFIPELVNYIQNNKGVTRGVCAMCLIRIGKACIEFLQTAVQKNPEFAWASNYIISEIQG